MKKLLTSTMMSFMLIGAPMMGGSLVLSGCATTAVQGTHAMVVRAHTDANNLYSAIASVVIEYQNLPGTTTAQKAAAEELKVKAWDALKLADTAYNSGIVANLDLLNSIFVQAKALKGTH